MKNNYFYNKPLSNIYKKPSKVSEVTSQIIYGERFKVLSKNKSWLRIKTSYDKYIGYIKDENYTDDHNPTHKIFAANGKKCFVIFFCLSKILTFRLDTLCVGL